MIRQDEGCFRITMLLSPNSPTPKIVLFPLAIVILIVAVFVSCKSDYPASSRQAGPGGPAKPARQVKTVAVVEAPFGESVTANGTLAAFDQTTVSVKVPGRLRSISVDLGTVVSRGQTIA